MSANTRKDADAQSSARVLYWCAWGFSSFGLLLVLFGIYFARLAGASSSWPKTEGKVERVGVRTYVSVNHQHTARGVRTYFPEVQYSYSVDGRPYASKRFSLGEDAQDYQERDDAVKAASAYRAGDAIDVYYDPSDPSSAVLQKGFTMGSWVPLLMGLVFGGFGALLFWSFGKLSPAETGPPAAPR
ncbi:MAG: DUF3592 domain-containing protein [Acidobacteria bacterium]|nr:DUF3592 domain-containing protein [Acidobacteriota bacterium]